MRDSTIRLLEKLEDKRLALLAQMVADDARFDQWLARVQAMALACEVRVAVWRDDLKPGAWGHVLLSPGERPPAGRVWTIHEYRDDIGWTGRSA